ncbi:MAG: GNAT family N-acetyltransferase [Rhodospirillales bacterium]|nr:GNAT family N-acetyltransferase [Rhodospirillales bacterium]
MNDIVWRWGEAEQADWSALIDRATDPVLEQSWAYGAAIAAVSPYRVRRGVCYRGDEPVALLQVFERPVAGIVNIAKILRGPALLAPLSSEEWVAMLQPIATARRIRYRRPLFWLPHLKNADAPMKQLGKRPMLVGHATAMLDLAQDEAALRGGLDGKWRNQLVKAEGGKLRVQQAKGGQTLQMLAERHEVYRRGHRHRGPSDREILALVRALERKDDALVLTAYTGNLPLAGMLFLRHGRGATYHAAWTSPVGRQENAHNLLLWRGMLAMKQRGAAFLDLGGLDAKAPGVARFKLGSGARVEELAATYL